MIFKLCFLSRIKYTCNDVCFHMHAVQYKVGHVLQRMVRSESDNHISFYVIACEVISKFTICKQWICNCLHSFTKWKLNKFTRAWRTKIRNWWDHYFGEDLKIFLIIIRQLSYSYKIFQGTANVNSSISSLPK